MDGGEKGVAMAVRALGGLGHGEQSRHAIHGTGRFSDFSPLSDDPTTLARVTEKLMTYWRVRSSDDPDGRPEWTQLDAAPASREGLVGEMTVENDDQVMVVYFEDLAAHDRVTRASKDAAALVREWEIPHQPARRPDGDAPAGR
jgi:hypothetical protein